MPEPSNTNIEQEVAEKLVCAAQFDQAEKAFKALVSGINGKTPTGLENAIALYKALDGLAGLYELTGDYDRALERLKDSRKVKEAFYGIDHPEIAIALRKLSDLEEILGNEAEADRLAVRALSIWLDFLGYSGEQQARKKEAEAENLNDLLTFLGRRSIEGLPQSLFAALSAKGRDLEPIKPVKAMLEIGLLFHRRRLFEEAKAYFSLVLQNAAELTLDAQAVAWRHLSAVEAHERNFHAAEQSELKHLTLARQFLSEEHPQITLASLNLAGLALAQGRIKDARLNAVKAKTALESSQADDSPAYAEALAMLAQIFQAENDLPAAELPLKKSIEIARSKFSESHPLIIRRLNLLTTIYASQQRFEEAESIYFRVIDVMGASTGPQPLVLSEFYEALANLYVVQGKFAKGEAVLQKALTIRQNLLVSNDLRIATTLSEVGNLYLKFGKYQDAEGNLKRALSILENLADTKAQSATQHENVIPLDSDQQKNLLQTRLAQCYLRQGRFSEAEKLSRQQLDTLENKHECNSFAYLSCLRTMAIANLFQFKLNNAQKPLARARQIVEESAKTFTPDAAALFLTIGDACFLSSNLNAAQEAYEIALAGASAQVDQAQVVHVKAIRRLALTLERLGQSTQSAQLLEEVLNEAENQLTLHAEEKVRTLLDVGLYSLKRGDTAKAINLFKQAINLCDLKIGPAHPLAGSINVYIARWHAARQELRQASEFYLRATSILDASLGANHWQLILPLTEFAMVCRAGGLLKDAQTLLRRAAGVSERTLGGSDATTVSVLALLSKVLSEERKDDQKLSREMQTLKERLKASIAQASELEKARLGLVEAVLNDDALSGQLFLFDDLRQVLSDSLTV